MLVSAYAFALVAAEVARQREALDLANRQLAEASRQLALASKNKSDFLANMSHELRTPLNAILGFSEVLLQRLFGELNPKQEEYLRDILSSGKHQLALVNDILDLSKVEAGRMELELTQFSLAALVTDASALLRERASRKGVQLIVATDETLGSINADERKIKQVLVNLLMNAIKFTPSGGTVTVAGQRSSASVSVSVTDTASASRPRTRPAPSRNSVRRVMAPDARSKAPGLG